MKNTILLLFCLLIPFALFGQKEGTIKTNDGVIHYIEFGSGYPILVINGGPGMNCNGFAVLAKLLSANNRVILFDQRGTGKSLLNNVDSTTVTMDLMAQDIETIRNYLHINDWLILGHSFGGILTQYYASKYPEHINALILSSSGGIDMQIFTSVDNTITSKLTGEEKDSLNYWIGKIDKGDTSQYAKQSRAKFLASAYVYNKQYVPQIAERLTQGYPKITELVYKDLYKINYDCKEKLKDFARPVLIIQGKQDIVPEEIALKEHSVLKNSSVVFIDECDHFGWVEQKEKYISAVENFIKSIN